MFNFGISELMVIAVVGLIVIGPERLPRVARTLGHLFGRMQRYVNDIKADINREVELDELRQLQSSMKEAADEIEKSVAKQVNYVEEEVKQAQAETRKSVEDAVKPAAGIDLMGPVNSTTGDAGEKKAQESTSKTDGDESQSSGKSAGVSQQANSEATIADSQDKRT
jgi:sec-independent protein translocase protein TatB